MSKKGEIVSAEGQDEPESASVFDFLYHDSRRVASYLSQFDNSGLLTGVTQSENSAKGTKRGKRLGLGGNTPLGGGSIELELGPGETGSEGMVRVYDPFWANAMQFLDVLEVRGMLQRDLSKADIGQFVLVKGWLSVLDLAMFKDAWKLPSVQKKVKEGAFPKIKSTMTQAQKAEIREQKDNADLMLEMIQIMPHSVHASLLSSDEDPQLLWCTLKEDYLVTPASDLTLAHGATMPGEWAIVGILSAKPDYLTMDMGDGVDESAPGVMQSVVGQVAKTIAPIVRVALGRPAAAGAITPLLIFREVT